MVRRAGKKKQASTYLERRVSREEKQALAHAPAERHQRPARKTRREKGYRIKQGDEIFSEGSGKSEKTDTEATRKQQQGTECQRTEGMKKQTCTDATPQRKNAQLTRNNRREERGDTGMGLLPASCISLPGDVSAKPAQLAGRDRRPCRICIRRQES